MSLENYRKYFFELTPLGKAEKEVRRHLEELGDEVDTRGYERALNQYRHMKMIQITTKALFYASIITSIAATIGLRGKVIIIERIASYLGTSLLFALFAITSYITLIRRENYHVKREILVSKASSEFR